MNPITNQWTQTIQNATNKTIGDILVNIQAHYANNPSPIQKTNDVAVAHISYDKQKTWFTLVMNDTYAPLASRIMRDHKRGECPKSNTEHLRSVCTFLKQVPTHIENVEQLIDACFAPFTNELCVHVTKTRTLTPCDNESMYQYAPITEYTKRIQDQTTGYLNCLVKRNNQTSILCTIGTSYEHAVWFYGWLVSENHLPFRDDNIATPPSEDGQRMDWYRTIEAAYPHLRFVPITES